ncbi:MAG TPA: type VI secretion system baseplate subunit TssG [Polyangiaceae bacterium]|nr:type VI secretion system baseplate subunit TssG [Polyangiaceae bacterium]
MAANDGQTPGALTWLEQLARAPGSFDFHAALRRFETERPDRPRLGEADRPADEPVRLGQLPSSAFEGAMLTSFTAREGADSPLLTIGFFGLWGPQGPLPGHLTDYARDRMKHAGDLTLVRFVDIFHHRMLLLFYRAWAKSHPTVSMDRPSSDRFALYVGALMGLGLRTSRNRDDIHDFVKLYHAPWFASPSRSADGLAGLLSDYFGLPIAIDEFVGDWLVLPQDERWHLGTSRETGTLGRAVIGARTWSRAHKFRVVIGPLDAVELEQMLPTSDSVEALASIVRHYSNDEWAWELCLLLSASLSTPMRLRGGSRLGWTTRVGRGPPLHVRLVVDPLTRRTRRTCSPEPSLQPL